MPKADIDEGVKIVEGLRKKIAGQTFAFKGTPVSITISLGVTPLKKGDSVESIVERADGALYKAKENGRNRVEISF